MERKEEGNGEGSKFWFVLDFPLRDGDRPRWGNQAVISVGKAIGARTGETPSGPEFRAHKRSNIPPPGELWVGNRRHGESNQILFPKDLNTKLKDDVERSNYAQSHTATCLFFEHASHTRFLYVRMRACVCSSCVYVHARSVLSFSCLVVRAIPPPPSS